VENAFGGNELEPLLPFIGRPKIDKDLVTAFGQTTAEIGKMPFAAAESLRR
jgi:hypothetical protein